MSSTDVRCRSPKPVRGSVSNYEISSKYNSLILNRGPYIPTYRLFRCPNVGCSKTLSPSTLLPHFLADHRELESNNLFPGGGVIMDVTAEFQDLEEMEPNAIRLIEIQETRMSDVPLLVNACCVEDKYYSIECNKNKSKPTHTSGQWVCLWLSSTCNFDNWFSMKLHNERTPQTSMTKICKPILVQHPMTTVDVLEDLNVMVVEHSTVTSICRMNERLKLEVMMYQT